MRNLRRLLMVSFLAGFLTCPGALYATNGDNLIGVGPIARSMGGVGIAHPQDAIGAVFANPAAMCFGPYCPSSEFNFAATMFMPHVEAKVENGGQVIEAESDENVYMIPAIGVSVPISSGPRFWRFGLAAYGVSGLGVDYRGTAIDNKSYYDFPDPFPDAPLISGEYSQLQIMKFAPAIAFQPSDRWSVGAAVHVDYGSLDLRSGSSSGYGAGIQLGTIYQATDNVSLGLVYISPQKISHDNVADFDQDGNLDSLDLESPQQLGAGIAYTKNKFLVEADLKWLNWSSADGYEDFDWDDQWVFAIGAQYEVMPKLFLRAGYNYAQNPVNEHDGFDGTRPVSVQGKTLPAYYYETFRVIGFPAIVEHHVTFGISYAFTDKFSFQLGYMHAFEKTIRETGTDFLGQPVALESTLSEDGVDFGFTWRF